MSQEAYIEFHKDLHGPYQQNADLNETNRYDKETDKNNVSIRQSILNI